MATNWCSMCKQEKDLSEFSPSNRKIGKTGKILNGECKKCNTKKSSKWRTKNRQRFNELARKYNHSKKAKNNYYMKTYGITKDEYDSIYEIQDGKCAICGKQNKSRPLSVDHCHNTNKVRGLLCIRCNSLIGFCDEESIILIRAMDYLRRTNVNTNIIR